MLVRDGFSLYSNAMVLHLPPSLSDHLPILLDTCPNDKMRPKPFRFKNFWIDDVEYQSVILHAWDGLVNGSVGHRLVCKLRSVKSRLMDWHKLFNDDINSIGMKF